MAPRERAPSQIEVEGVATEEQLYSAESRRKYGVYCTGLLLTLVALLLIIAIVVTLFLLEGDSAKVVLPVLLVLLALVAITAFAFIRWQHSKAVEQRQRMAVEWIHRTVSQQQLAANEQQQTRRASSWAFWKKRSSSSAPSTASASRRPEPTAPPASSTASTDTSMARQPYSYSALPTAEVKTTLV